MQKFLKTEHDTKELGNFIANNLEKGDVILLNGDLGSGKTSLTKYIINALTNQPTEVTSPTFNIMQPYETPNFTVFHYDLYRLKNSSELEEIGIEEQFSQGVSIIEWPEIADGFIPDDNLLLIELSFTEKKDRLANISGTGHWIKQIKTIS